MANSALGLNIISGTPRNLSDLTGDTQITSATLNDVLRYGTKWNNIHRPTATVTLTGDEETYTFSGLTKTEYIFDFRFKLQGVFAAFGLCVNGDTTETNYRSQLHEAYGSSHGVGPDNTSAIAYANANCDGMFKGYCHVSPSGYFCAQAFGDYNVGSGTTVNMIQFQTRKTTDTISSVTSLTVTSIIGVIKSGSILSIWEVL